MEPVNGIASHEDEDEDSDETKSINSALVGRGSDARSVSSTVHDRTRSSASGPSSAGTARRPSSPKAPHHHHGRHTPQPPPSSSAAKESFLNLFFGQNGTGPVTAASVHKTIAPQDVNTIVPVGRDVSGGEPPAQTGLLASQRNIEGNNAAFDMKSLGKHIEAVRHRRFHIHVSSN